MAMPCDDLVQAHRDDHEGEEGRHHDAGRDRAEGAQREDVAALDIDGHAGEGADEHDPLGAEIQHARPLVDDEPDGRQHERHGKDRRERDPIDDEFDHA